MTDRELLELAAKAAGIEWYGMAGDDNDSCAYFDIGPDEVVKWNPLEDDAAALRLAVKLNLKVYQAETAAIVHQRMSHSYVGEAYDENGMDKYAATRRAIVRAAAEIGKQHD